MDYENKVLVALEKIVDAIFYEEGRLAVINKYGAFLNDAEKVQATELITKQRAGLDRLFEIYKKELEPVMMDIFYNGKAMSPLVMKLVSSDVVVQQMLAQTDATANKTAINVPEGFDNQTVVGTETTVTESPAVEGVENNQQVETADVFTGMNDSTEPVQDVTASMEGSAPVENVEQPMVAPINQDDSASVAVVAENDTNILANETGGENTISAGTIDVNGSSSDSVEAAAGEVFSNFVLSPIDEDVAPVPTKETKEAEEGIANAEQQLQAIDAVKTEIVDNPNLTEEEKTAELEKYTRMTDGVVRAILVTKAQFEKLLVSRKSQKDLLKAGSLTEPSQEVVAIPDIIEAGGSSIDSTSSVVPVVDGGAQENTGVGGETPNEVVLPNIEIPGVDVATAGEQAGVSESGVKQAELQTMIEQANALYKEGKTAEAQALFDKVGAINKELQDAAVLVKK